MKTHSIQTAVLVILMALDAGVLLAQPKPPVPPPSDLAVYVTDLSPPQGSGVQVGNFDNLAFTLDLKSSLRQLAIAYDQPHPELLATYDFADCSKGQERLLEQPLAALKGGDTAWVDYVDIALVPPPQRELRWSGGVCFGTRGPSGTWRWNLSATPLVLDAASDRVRARIWIKDGPINAVKLVFDQSVPRQYVQTLTVVARPYHAAHN